FLLDRPTNNLSILNVNGDAANNTFVAAINNLNQIVANYDIDLLHHGVALSSDAGATWTPLPVPGAVNAYASSIDGFGNIAGRFLNGAGHLEGFVANLGPSPFVQALNVPGATDTTLWGLGAVQTLDAAATVAYLGYRAIGQHDDPQAFLLEGGAFFDIDVAGAREVRPLGIADN